MNAGRMTLVLLASAALSLCVVAADELSPPRAGDRLADGITVEALGMAPMPAGKPLAEVHREALLDARRNAVIQAHVIVEAQDLVEDMRLQESILRSRAVGYVEQMEVWEAGAVPDSQPPVYRVRVRALVRPMQTFSTLAALGQSRRDPWQPALALSVEGNAEPQDLERARAALSDALRRCGIVVLEAGEGRPALALHMSVTVDPEAGGRSAVADWELSVGQGPQAGALPSPGIYVGHWQLGARGRGADPWRRVGLTIAQDTIRLWAAPRWTTVRILGTNPAQAGALAGSFSRAEEARVNVAEDRSEVTVELPLAGDPLVAVEALVRRAGLSSEPELVESSLTRLTYRCRPGAR